jgi:hypothetical protein
MDGISRLARASIPVQIVNAADGGSSVWSRRAGCIPGAIRQTGLTSGDTILTWMRVGTAAAH